MLTVTNRHKQRAQELAEPRLPVLQMGEPRHECDILINCTPVGMHPDVDETPYPEHWLRENMLVFDTIYNPENTLLIKEAKERAAARSAAWRCSSARRPPSSRFSPSVQPRWR